MDELLTILTPQVVVGIALISCIITIICVIISFRSMKKALYSMQNATNSFSEAANNITKSTQHLETAFMSMLDVMGKIHNLKQLEELKDTPVNEERPN